MKTAEKIKQFISGQPDPKKGELEELHRITLKLSPDKLWFSDGKNEDGKVVANPTIGYGSHLLKYANGKTAESFKIGISANQTGISVYILGIEDKTFLAKTYEKTLGKAKVTGYCIKFKTLKDIDITVLENAIRYGLEHQNV